MCLVGNKHHPGKSHDTVLVGRQIYPVLRRQLVPEHSFGPRGRRICRLQRHHRLEVVDGERSNDHGPHAPAHGPS